MATLPSLSITPTIPSVGFEPRTYAVTMREAALDAISQLGQIASSFSQEPISFQFDPAPAQPVLNLPDRPTLLAITAAFPTVPSPLNVNLTIDDIMPAAFDDEAPDLNLPSAPASFTETAPDSPGITTSFGDPGDLVVSLPAAPALLSLSIGNFAGTNFPTFAEEAPEIELVAPGLIPYEPGAQYTSSLMTLLRSTFLTRIQDGGTGLPPEVENAIWDRGREREAKSSAEAIRKLEQMEAMGFAFPPGVYLDARLRIITETDAAIKGHSREVMIKQAELEQANIQKSLELANQLEGQWLDSWNKIEDRKFQTAKYQTEAQVSIFNARVEGFKAMLEAYKSKVQVYEAQVRAETQKVEAYRAQIAAEQAKAEVNRALVEQYKVQTDVALSAIEVFKAKVDAIRTKAEIEKLKVEIFREQISAFTAKVNAYSAQVEAYKAGSQAEVSKQDAFKARVEAYRAHVEAASKVIEARISELEGKIKIKQSEYDGYKATVEGESARIRGLSEYNSALTDQYKGDVQASAALNDALSRQWSATIEYIKGKAEVATQVAKTNSDIITASANVQVEAAKAAGQIAAQIGAAALSAYNISASASMSASASVSASDSTSDSKSNSVSDSTSYSKSDVNSVSDNTSRSTSESNSTVKSDSYSNSFGISFSDNTSRSSSTSQSTSDSKVDSKSYNENKNYNL